jgi:hypothetical protein
MFADVESVSATDRNDEPLPMEAPRRLARCAERRSGIRLRPELLELGALKIVD